MKKVLSWKELFVIAGLQFVDREYSEKIDLKDTKENIMFIKNALREILDSDVSINNAFRYEAPDLNLWVSSLTKHGGKCSEEIFKPNEINLREIDVMMLGLIRQLNGMRIYTRYSCSGHSNRKPYIGFLNHHDTRNAKEIFMKLGVASTITRGTVLELNLPENKLMDLGLELYYLSKESEKMFNRIKTQRKLNLLENLLAINGKSGQEKKIRDFVYKQIVSLVDTVKIDEYGNLLAQKKYGDGNTILLSAHLDVVDIDINPDSEIIKENGVWRRERGILGADDRAGVSIVINLLNEIGKSDFDGTLKIALTVEEEIGRFGAENIDKNFFNDVNFAISFDRRNSSDIVTHSSFQRYCSIEFGFMLEEVSKRKFGMSGYKCVLGGISDLTVWSAMGIESVNLSIGFYNEHTYNEYLVIDEWLRSQVNAKLIINKLGSLKSNDYKIKSIA